MAVRHLYTIKGSVDIKDPQQLTPTGVLLINMGTPSAPTPSAVRKYLREFLSDPRIIALPRWLWLPILYGIVLMRRPFLSAIKYQKIWTKRGSPLLFHTQDQAKALQQTLLQRNLLHVKVTYAMRYGAPCIQQSLNQLVEQGCQQIIALPLYPQHATSSTVSALDSVYRSVLQMHKMPTLCTIPAFYQDKGYITALEKHIRSYWQQHGQGEHLVMSFHGIPVAQVEKGDPYFDHCLKTAEQLAFALGMHQSQYSIAFQSRFGKAAWLSPSTNETLTKLAKSGIKKLDIVCPGFVADCLETLEEIAIEGRQQYKSSGGATYHYIPCLNTNQDWIEALANLCQQHMPA